MPADTLDGGLTPTHSLAVRIRVVCGSRERVTANVCPTIPAAIDAMRAEPSSGGRLGGTSGCDGGPRSTSYVTVVSTHTAEQRRRRVQFRPWSYCLNFFPDGKGELPSCHTKSIRGNPCMTSRFVDKGIAADRRMTSSDVIGPGTKCWRAQASQSGNISASTGARAVRQSAAFGNMTVLTEGNEVSMLCFPDSVAAPLIREPGFSSRRCLCIHHPRDPHNAAIRPTAPVPQV